MTVILQSSLPYATWTDPRLRRLPGTVPLALDDWLKVDDAYAGQMALRDHLIATCPDRVHGMTDQAKAAAEEVYDMILPRLPGLGFAVAGDQVTRPDGGVVRLDRAQPLLTLGRLVQEDLCLMQEDGQGEHLLSAAILCFPAGWVLAEKLGRAMMRIHKPVEKYTEDVGRRVQRLFDAVRVEAPLWRANAHHSRAPLFNPLSEQDSRLRAEGELPWIRAERQAIIRLPQSRAVLFSIHTYLVALENLTEDQRAALDAHPIHNAR